MAQYDVVFTVNASSVGENFSEQKILLGKGQMLIGTQTFPMALPPFLNDTLLFGDDQEASGVRVISKEELLGKIGLIAKMHYQLYALVSNEQLIPGASYLITDYRTTYNQPVSNISMQGELEPLVVKAISTSEFDPVAVSTLHPRDIIYYDINSIQSRVPGCSKGYIYRRIDALQNNDLPFDFRQVKFRRWKITSSWSFGTIPNGGYASPQATSWNGFTVNYSDYDDFHFFAGMIYANSYNNFIASSGTNLLENCNCIVGDAFRNNVIGVVFKNNTIGGDFRENSITGDFSENLIRGQFYRNFISGNFNNNKLNTDLTMNTVKGTFSSNFVDSNFYSNTFHGSFQNNTVGTNHRGNVYRNTFLNGVIDNNFENNTIRCYMNYKDLDNHSLLHSTTITDLYYDYGEEEFVLVFLELSKLTSLVPAFIDLTPPPS